MNKPGHWSGESTYKMEHDEEEQQKLTVGGEGGKYTMGTIIISVYHLLCFILDMYSVKTQY